MLRLSLRLSCWIGHGSRSAGKWQTLAARFVGNQQKADWHHREHPAGPWAVTTFLLSGDSAFLSETPALSKVATSRSTRAAACTTGSARTAPEPSPRRRS